MTHVGSARIRDAPPASRIRSLRLSIGLENERDLIEDLTQALEFVGTRVEACKDETRHEKNQRTGTGAAK